MHEAKNLTEIKRRVDEMSGAVDRGRMEPHSATLNAVRLLLNLASRYEGALEEIAKREDGGGYLARKALGSLGTHEGE